MHYLALFSGQPGFITIDYYKEQHIDQDNYLLQRSRQLRARAVFMCEDLCMI